MLDTCFFPLRGLSTARIDRLFAQRDNKKKRKFLYICVMFFILCPQLLCTCHKECVFITLWCCYEKTHYGLNYSLP